MKLIAKRPCSFGGKQYFIGDEVPVNFVADVKMQEKLGVILIANGQTAGGRKRIRDTAKKQTDKLFSSERTLEESEKENADSGTNIEGEDA